MTKWLVVGLAVGVVLYLARAIMPPFIVAAVLAYLFSPVVDGLQARTGQRRGVIVGLLYVVLLALLGFGVWLLETSLAREVRELGREGPNMVDAAFVRLLGNDVFDLFGQRINPHDLAIWTNERLSEISGRPTDALQLAERAVDTVLKVVLTLLALFYLLLDGHRIGPAVLRFVAPDQREHVGKLAERVHAVLGRYLRGQLFLIALMSVVTSLMLTFVFHLPYAVPLGIATGILEVIPLLGPWLAGGMAAIVALVYGGPGLAVAVGVAFFVLRMAEDQLVMPFVVGRAVHLHPLVTIFAVLLGGSLAGVLGAVLAVPVAAAVRVTLDYAFPTEDAVAPSGEDGHAAVSHPNGPAVRASRGRRFRARG